MRLQGKISIITGAAHGMGAAEAHLFAAEGSKVVVADVLEVEGNEVAKEISTSGGEAIFVQMDATSEEDWQRTVQKTVSQFGGLNVLVNNAGISASAFPDETDTDGWNRLIEVNATSTFLGTKHAVPEMKKAGGGSIVNISSILGLVGSEYGHPGYHAAKGAVRLFTKATAVKYGPDGIRANSIHPGLLPAMRSVQRNPSDWTGLIEQTPLRRQGEQIEVAYGVLFLASDEASYITGTELVIDGGVTAR